jgi:hypothetical protein
LSDDGSGAHVLDGCAETSLTDFSYSGQVAELPDVDPPTEPGPERDPSDFVVVHLAAELAASIDVARITAEEAVAARRLSMIEAGRRKGGLLGAAAAGAMLGIRDVYEGPPKDDDIVIVSEAPGDPEDIDLDGISGRVADVDFWAPPPGDPRI